MDICEAIEKEGVVGCVGKAWGSMWCPDADHKDRHGEMKPNLKAAGSRIMRLQFTVNFRRGTKRHSTRQERGRCRCMDGWGESPHNCALIQRCMHIQLPYILICILSQTTRKCCQVCIDADISPVWDKIFIIPQFQSRQLHTDEELAGTGKTLWHWGNNTVQFSCCGLSRLKVEEIAEHIVAFWSV